MSRRTRCRKYVLAAVELHPASGYYPSTRMRMGRELQVTAIRRIEIALLFGACAIIFWWAYEAYNKVGEAPVGLAVVATEADAVKHVSINKIIVTAPIKVRSGEEIKRKLNLSEVDIKNPKLVVAAAATVEADDHAVDIITKLNKETGEFETVKVKKELPWLTFSTNGEAGIYAGLLNGNQAVRAQVIQDFVQVKAVRISGIISADQVIGSADINNPIALSTFVGVGARYKW